jgi:hypothetical protein
MIDYYLKFETEADAAVLYDGDQPKYPNTDVIGVIYKPTGATVDTPDGPMPEMAPLDGWHVNVRCSEEQPELDAYVVQVKTPVRVWA